MSKSVRDYTEFTARVNSAKGKTQQNSRFRPVGILRLLVVCTLVFSLFFALPVSVKAQPPDYLGPGWWDSPDNGFWDLTDPLNPVWVPNNPFGHWAPTTTPGTPLPAPPPFPQAAPYVNLWTNEANWTGWADRYTGVSINLTGSVRGGFAWNSTNTLGNANNHWWIGNADTLWMGATALSVAGSGSVYLLEQLTVEGNLSNSGEIYNIGGYSSIFTATNPRNPSGYLGINVLGNAVNNAGGVIRESYILNVSKNLLNMYNSTTAGRGIINNLMYINVGSLENYGLIDQSSMFGIAAWSTAYITVADDLINGGNFAATGGVIRTRRSAEIISDWYYGYPGPPDSYNTGIQVGGNLVQWFDGSIRARGGSIDVLGELYNAGEIRLLEGLDPYDTGRGYSNRWYIRAGSIFNDGRSWAQWSMTRGLYDSSGVSGQAWGIIYDAQIVTLGDLTNIGVNAVIDGMVYTDLNIRWLNTEASTEDVRNSMHVGGTLYNLDRASILNYNNVVIHGDFVNRGALFVGGSWSRHSNITDRYEHVMTHHVGRVDVWENLYNLSEDTFAASGGLNQSGSPTVLDNVYGGLIASFDVLNIHGSVFNDANSMITGSYTHDGTGPYGTEGSKDPYTIHGRRASILGGVMLFGEYHDAPTLFNVMGIFSNHEPGEVPFHGLFNEGHIREIDILSVGSTEAGILWNTLTLSAPRTTFLANGSAVGTPATITDIGAINTTNLYNSGTISDIDTAINVSFALFNDVTGVLDGYSPFHLEWQYDDQGVPIFTIPIYDDEGEIIGYETARPVVEQETRANLLVGRASETNPFVLQKLVDVGDGIINHGKIENFDIINTQGNLLNTGSIGDVASLTVGLNTDETTRADMDSFGELYNIDSITVTKNLRLGMGSVLTDIGTIATHNNILMDTVALENISTIAAQNDIQMMDVTLNNIGTINARNNIRIIGDVDGGFGTLRAERGDLIVTGAWQRDLVGRRVVDPVTGMPLLTETSSSLTIDRGALASGNTSFQNYGTVMNYGLLSSAMGIRNDGIIENNGMINAFNGFQNTGVITGDGMVHVATGVFENSQSGIISGSLTISGNFQNVGGTVLLSDSRDVVRITNGGVASLVGGMIDVQYSNPVVGDQYMFMAADTPGDLHITQAFRGLNTGSPGSVLDYTPSHGYWDGEKYVANRASSQGNQYYWLEFQRAYSYGAHAHTPNQIALGRYIDTIGGAPIRDSGLWNLFQQLDGISDGYYSGNVDAQGNVVRDNPYFNPDYAAHQGQINPAALKALDELGGSIYSTIGVASAHNVGIVQRSLADALRSDVFQFSFVGNPNNAIRGQAIAPLRYTRWGTAFGIGGSSGNDGNANGYRQSFGGILAGIDRAFWTGTRFGGWVSLATGDVTMKRVNENTDVTNIMVGVYMRQEMYYGYGLVSAGFGGDTYKTKRNLTMIGHRAESKFKSGIGTIYLERGIDLPIYYATIQPHVSFQATRVDRDSFTERMWDQYGQLTDVGLVGSRAKTDSCMMSLGARTSSSPIAMRWGQVAFTTNTAWFHDFNGGKNREFIGRFGNPDGNNYGIQFANASFKIAGNNPKQDWFNFGVGVHMDRNSTRVNVGADMLTNERQTLFSGFAGVSTSW